MQATVRVMNKRGSTLALDRTGERTVEVFSFLCFRRMARGDELFLIQPIGQYRFLRASRELYP